MKTVVNFTQGIPVFQFLAMATGTLTIISCGMNTGWPSISLPKFLNEDSNVSITNNEGSWIAVMPKLGSIFGNCVASMIVDKTGRKVVILLTTFPSFIGWIVVAYVPSVWALIIGRFISGISDGAAFCVLPLYLSEIADSKIRGFIGSSVVAARIFGTLLINVIGAFLDPTPTASIASACSALCLLTFCWMPESPYYFIMKEHFEQARKSLQVFKGTDDVRQELERLQQAVKEQQENTGRYLDLFTVESNRKALVISLVTFGVQQLSGTMAITYYAKTIFEQAGDATSSNNATIIFFSVQLVVCTCCSMVVDKLGRKPLLIVSLTGSGLALFIEGLFFFLQNNTDLNTSDYEWVPIAALVIYVIMFSIGMQTLPILLLGEMFPTNVKAVASSLGNIYFCILATVVSKLFQITKDEFGLHVPFFAFATVCAIGLVLIMLLVPETKGKTLEDIQLKLKGSGRTNATFNVSPKTCRKSREV